uniref:Trehalase n=1 Tax=Parastrongyloides trichosuri TaxID=131310 RepID=A0A0N4ZHR0_PARTI
MPSEVMCSTMNIADYDISPEIIKETNYYNIEKEEKSKIDKNISEGKKSGFEENSVVKDLFLNNMRFNIYCTGSLLDLVQKYRLFKDCKHFVDMPLKYDADVVFKKWTKLLANCGGNVDKLQVENFVLENFDEPGRELEDYIPQDYNIGPDNLKQISDSEYRHWALDLHARWPTLCRKVKQSVIDNAERYSLIALPKPFVVPGGRFREMYYWDSFFTIKGLLASKMYKTVHDMIDNMGYMIDKFGFIPNGNRVYYLNRSQPPLMSWCIDAYIKETGEYDFITKALPWIEKELQFFKKNRTVKLSDWKSHLYRFHVNVESPRPESYREDLECSEDCEDLKSKKILWGEIAAAAESGRDFSSRWFAAMGSHMGDIKSIRTSRVLPVELNAILVKNLSIAEEYSLFIGDHEKQEKYKKEKEDLIGMIHDILWNDDLGCWFDYDMDKNHQILTYYDTNFFPLITGCKLEKREQEKVANYISTNGLLDYPGGLPTSLITSGEQWDFPNSWAPTTWIVIEGLSKNDQPELAKLIADRWLKKTYTVWKNTDGKMFEKYNVTTGCDLNIAGGGEYVIQEGFGWTNGVILDLLMKYKHDAKYNDSEPICGSCICKQVTKVERKNSCSVEANEIHIASLEVKHGIQIPTTVSG